MTCLEGVVSMRINDTKCNLPGTPSASYYCVNGGVLAARPASEAKMWYAWGCGVTMSASIITAMDKRVLACLIMRYEMGHATVTRTQLHACTGAACAAARLGVHWGRSTTSTHCKHARRSYPWRTRWAARQWTLKPH